MPLVLQKYIENGVFGLWEISEEADELENFAKLSFEDLITYSSITALHRRKEWLATRALLNQLAGEPMQIKYSTEGCPFLEKGKYHISISHTAGFVAVILHKIFIPGIDIEHSTRQVGRVASRFLSADEFGACTEQSGISNRKLLLHWCAKEAIFKMVPFTNVEFSTDIQISLNDTVQKNGSFNGKFVGRLRDIPISLEYLEKDGVILVWGTMPKIISS
jgi:4'-phosphopantetheinyl transferase